MVNGLGRLRHGKRDDGRARRRPDRAPVAAALGNGDVNEEGTGGIGGSRRRHDKDGCLPTPASISGQRADEDPLGPPDPVAQGSHGPDNLFSRRRRAGRRRRWGGRGGRTRRRTGGECQCQPHDTECRQPPRSCRWSHVASPSLSLVQRLGVELRALTPRSWTALGRVCSNALSGGSPDSLRVPPSAIHATPRKSAMASSTARRAIPASTGLVVW